MEIEAFFFNLMLQFARFVTYFPHFYGKIAPIVIFKDVES